MGKLTSTRARSKPTTLPSVQAATNIEMPPDNLEGDGLLKWLRENQSAYLPSDDQLAAVRLIGDDCIARHQWLFALAYDDLSPDTDIETVRAYFQKDPYAVFSDDGARLNGLHRELAERHNLPNGRWGIGARLAPRPAWPLTTLTPL